MTASGGLYPALGKHFKNMTELAHAGNMNRDTMRKCLNGERQFTRSEKKCISANIAMKLMNSTSYDYQELEDANRAWSGEFDEIYRRKEES
jgi:hypothetical protein